MLSAGVLSTVQDGGRRGYLSQGVTEGGAMDDFARRLGQRLLGNDIGAAAIEVAYGGLVIETTDELNCVLTGAMLEATHNDSPVPFNRVFTLGKGEQLHLGRPEFGVYSYVSVGGGFDTPPVLNSRSTVIREGLGGLNGCALQAGDVVPIGSVTQSPPIGRLPARARFPRPSLSRSSVLTLRYLPGFQHTEVADDAIQALQTQRFHVSGSRDRMGARLSGPVVNTGMQQLWSEATCQGAIQVPPDGQPIVLLNDRQTMGGYPKLGAVIRPDCVRLAQAPVGQQVRFEALSPELADRVLWLETNYERELSRAITSTP